MTRRRLIQWITLGAAVVVALIALMIYLRRDDVLRASLDPKQPFQTWTPPPAPDYSKRAAWALIPKDPDSWSAGDPPADVFFIHPTTYDGGRDWNAAIDRGSDDRQLQRTVLPNYAGPFQRVGRVFAPRYRQASLFASLTNRDDARESRRFAYGDVRRAFLDFLACCNRDRPIVVAGVEQGGALAARLLDEQIAPNPELSRRVAAVYVMDAVVPARRYPAAVAYPACRTRTQAHCLVAWVSARQDSPATAQRIVERAFVWNFNGGLTPLGAREPLCVNPITGSVDQPYADVRQNRGAANATGLEWGARPAFLARQVSARCEKGVLRVSAPTSPSLVLAGGWADKQKVAPYNLFYADIEADATARVAAALGRTDLPSSAASIERSVVVGDAPINKVD